MCGLFSSALDKYQLRTHFFRGLKLNVPDSGQVCDELCQFLDWCVLSCIATKAVLVILRWLETTHTNIFFWQSSSPNFLFDEYCGYYLAIKQPGHEVDRSPCTPVPRLLKRETIHVLPLYAFVGSTVTVKTKLQARDIKLSEPILISC